jgi:radical SAM superfamily enzyme YgiQ (UPF0313 family)
MKVLLIYPYASFKVMPPSAWMPLSLSYLAAPLLRAGHEVKIFDRYAAQFRAGQDKSAVDRAMLKALSEFRPDVVAFNTVSPLVFDLVECAALVRHVFNGPLLAGGHHVTALPQATLNKIPQLDAVICGEGEYSLLHYIEGQNHHDIPGLWFRENGSIIGSPPVQIPALDQLPFPDFSLMDLGYYLNRSLDTIRHRYVSTISLLTSRGCVKKCEFCSESLTYGKGVRFHSPEYVAELVYRVYKDYGIEGIYFHDNDFLINRARTEKICDLMMKRGLHKQIIWGIQARAEHIELALVKRLKQAGCVLIEIGIESSSQAVLDAMHKDSTVEVNQRAIKVCQEGGMGIHSYMLTGVEGETQADLEQRLEWLKKVRPNSFSWSQLEIHPGTRLYERLRRGVFETMPWTRDAVRDYYYQQNLSAITAEDRAVWMRKHYEPYQRLIRRYNTIRTNRPRRLWSFFAMKAKEKLSRQGKK